MKNCLYACLLTGALGFTAMVDAQVKYPALSAKSDQAQTTNQLPATCMPVMGVWVWNDDILKPGGYKEAIDMAGAHSPFNLIIPFLRFPEKEVVDDAVYQQVKLAAAYAVEHNLAFVPDLDVRSARRAFKRQYPDELQQMLRLQEVSLSVIAETETVVSSIDNLNDHYAGGKIPPYNALSNALLRVCAYKTTPEGIVPESVKDITALCKTTVLSEDSLGIVFPKARDGQTHACAMVTFTLFYPDIFAPHLQEFQRSILLQYADVPVAGVCKDEWGFPPYFPRFYQQGVHDFWYSAHSAKTYAEKTGGRELLGDCFLMSHPVISKETERQTAVNHFMEMIFHRNVELEGSFYDNVKEIYGPDAAVTVHPTWWPYPDYNEYKKNGLDWWSVKRDWAQTDEIVPFAVRTALCKKWNSPIWYNMYYTMKLPVQVWSSALAGGRINYLGYQTLYDPDIMRAENSIRLLNFISESPVDCRVAVVFGHAATVNWAGAYHNDVGMKLADTLWFSGYPADLIPTSEIENGSLKVDEEGWICYGKQRYTAVVLYHPEYEKHTTGDFFNRASKGHTRLFRIGAWTSDFKGNAVNGDELLPAGMTVAKDHREALQQIIPVLLSNNILKQTPATDTLDNRYFRLRGFNTISYFPPTTGFSKLLDGTIIKVAGTKQISGDPIQQEFEVNGHTVAIDAIGTVGVRLDKNGDLQALAASRLKSFKTAKQNIELPERMDVALWVDAKGVWHGVVQGHEGPIPEALLRFTSDWSRLGLPEPPAMPVQ